ncbi:carboxypeptidase-like regulatory domain-containing protein [Flavobacterium sp. DG1-102-2]|uniref:carboxypeptidase-like regulatory domain-containing protein n=1 Tax=Flavobacterium sp. DG1-102-2 TaxID=3081663 RepID=UPI0029495BF6|nr:carboxypeptidase-like regulatory domain-containing protein [Flavobacterium sp. DG1-102-2]MDV6166796.1 carboxypeptidase-like regulatory domain-containing protein [Flavobacterium sp. DG1-102-2]
MKKPIKISISTPCHENWDAMTPAEKGRFCASCQKNVYDFTRSSDREIALILENKKNACGRFTTSQLDRDLIIPKEKSTLWIAASAAVVSFLTIGNSTISAQTPMNTEQTNFKTDEIIGKVTSSKNIIGGTVMDSEGIVILGANVILKNSKEVTQTDFDGKFSIEAQKGDIIQITSVGMLTHGITVTDKKTYNVVMKDDNTPLEDVEMEIYGGISVHRTFFGRIFHSIGSIFR